MIITIDNYSHGAIVITQDNYSHGGIFVPPQKQLFPQRTIKAMALLLSQ